MNQPFYVLDNKNNEKIKKPQTLQFQLYTILAKYSSRVSTILFI